MSEKQFEKTFNKEFLCSIPPPLGKLHELKIFKHFECQIFWGEIN